MKNYYLLITIVTLLITSCNDNVLEELPTTNSGSVIQTRSSSYISGDKDVNFGLSLKYDNGIDPAIAINTNKNVLEVHRGTTCTNQLWYRVGVTNQMSIEWSSNASYDTGCDPSVALNNDNVAVEVHRSPVQAIGGEWVKSGWLWYYKIKTYYKTWYHVGALNNGNVYWGGSVNYGDGEEPDIAMNNKKTCVEVHRSGTGIYYRVGGADSNRKTIDFGNNNQFATGYAPEIAINNKNQAVAIYHDSGSNLFYQTGTINTNNKTITWGAAKLYGKGNKGDVALTDNGDVIETHILNGELYKVTGLLNTSSKSVAWLASTLFDKGTYTYEKGSLDTPGVAIDSDGSIAIQTHSTRKVLSAIDRNLKCSTSLFINRLTWMEDESSNLNGKYLYEICMPGSHDAGTYNISTSSKRIAFSNGYFDKMSLLLASLVAPFAKAQNLSILEQLKVGVRFFDLRPHYNNYSAIGDSSAFYASHGGMIGGAFKDMLDDLRTFMNSTHGEIVVVRLGWFSNFDKSSILSNDATGAANHKAFAKLLKSYLGDYLYNNNSETYSNLKYDDVVRSGNGHSKVIVLYAGQDDQFYKEHGFFPFQGFYDDYANTTDYNTMSANQLSKLKSHHSQHGNAFLLDWALTINVDDAAHRAQSLKDAAVSSDLEGLSNLCNINLRGFTAKYGKDYKIGILFTDYVQKSASTDCAIMLNRLR